MTTPLLDERTELGRTERTRTERFRVSGDQLLARIRELVHQGNARRVIIVNDDGRTLLEIPLTFGMVSAVLTPVWVAIGAIAALAAEYTLLVEVTETAERDTSPLV
jgi:hypothetical protein